MLARENQRASVKPIIEKLNDLFHGDLTEHDKLVYLNDVLKEKLLESETLKEQATNNIKDQFANSPDLKSELLKRSSELSMLHTAMSTQALESPAVREQATSFTSAFPLQHVRDRCARAPRISDCVEL